MKTMSLKTLSPLLLALALCASPSAARSAEPGSWEDAMREASEAIAPSLERTRQVALAPAQGCSEGSSKGLERFLLTVKSASLDASFRLKLLHCQVVEKDHQIEWDGGKLDLPRDIQRNYGSEDSGAGELNIISDTGTGESRVYFSFHMDRPGEPPGSLNFLLTGEARVRTEDIGGKGVEFASVSLQDTRDHIPLKADASLRPAARTSPR